MTLEFGLTDDHFNSRYAPLTVLAMAYQQRKMLEPLNTVQIAMKKRDISAIEKLKQVLISILTGCETVSEVNTKLKGETALAQAWQWPRIIDQSNLSRALDVLTLMNLEQLRDATTEIWREHGRTWAHDWRGYLWLDFDLSGLPSGAGAEKSEKGYFSGKKTPLGVS